MWTNKLSFRKIHPPFRLNASKEVNDSFQNTCNTNKVMAGQSSSRSSIDKSKEEEGGLTFQQHLSQRETALMKIMLMRKHPAIINLLI
ncbi:hypothetical protein Bca4012_093238 [Brassica carinata]